MVLESKQSELHELKGEEESEDGNKCLVDKLKHALSTSQLLLVSVAFLNRETFFF